MANQPHRDSTSYTENASKRLWTRFAEMFGARFYDQFGSEPSGAWREAVSELRADQVKAALTKVRNSGAQYPPSLPEFVALARAQAPPKPEQPQAHYDDLHCFGNRALFFFLEKKGRGASRASLSKLVIEKNRLVENFRLIQTEEKLTADEVRVKLFERFEQLYEAQPEAELDAAREHFKRTGRLPTWDPTKDAQSDLGFAHARVATPNTQPETDRC